MWGFKCAPSPRTSLFFWHHICGIVLTFFEILCFQKISACIKGQNYEIDDRKPLIDRRSWLGLFSRFTVFLTLRILCIQNLLGRFSIVGENTRWKFSIADLILELSNPHSHDAQKINFAVHIYWNSSTQSPEKSANLTPHLVCVICDVVEHTVSSEIGTMSHTTSTGYSNTWYITTHKRYSGFILTLRA